MANGNEQSNIGDTSEADSTIVSADRALRSTVQRFLDSAGMTVDLSKVEQQIRDKPIPSAAIAAAAGFVVGGGLVTGPGLALVALFGRNAARETVTNVVSGKVRNRFR
jgi:hypothetical protein